MKIEFTHHHQRYAADLGKPLDIAIPLRNGLDNPNCFWAPAPQFAPVEMGDFIGSTAKGGPVNFFNVRFNPHGNGTHTECVGHIAKERYVIRETLQEAHFMAKVVSIYPQRLDNGDRVMLLAQLKEVVAANEVKALVIRTMPNDDRKMYMNYSGANPPYLHHEATGYLAACGIEHLLIDLPSVDREEDGGELLAHRAFWQYPDAVRGHCTITELIYVPNTIRDGLYLLNLQTACFDLDASPSRPVLYGVEELRG
jgi:arylformamidase